MTPFETLVAVRNRYPALIQTAQCVAILNEVCYVHRAEGLGLLLKTTGNHAAQPRTGTRCSVDWIVDHGTGMGGDCLINTPSIDEGDIPRPATPTWNASDLFDLNRFVAPVLPEGAPVPPDPPQPPDPPVDELAARVAALEAEVAALTVTVAHQSQDLQQLTQDLGVERLARLAADEQLQAAIDQGGSGPGTDDVWVALNRAQILAALAGRKVSLTGATGRPPQT